MRSHDEITCPGCGLTMPPSPSSIYRGYYNTSAECWMVYTEVLAAEYSNAVLFGQAHQMSVDSYAVQHAGGGHPDKSVGVHLCGLHLVLQRGLAPTSVPPRLQRIVAAINTWPHFDPPRVPGCPTVLEVALASSAEEHCERVRAWARALWEAWSPHHEAVARLVERNL